MGVGDWSLIRIFICYFFYLVWLRADVCWLSGIVIELQLIWYSSLLSADTVPHSCSQVGKTARSKQRESAKCMPKFGSSMKKKVMNCKHFHFRTIVKFSSSETILICSFFCLCLRLWCLLAMIYNITQYFFPQSIVKLFHTFTAA